MDDYASCDSYEVGSHKVFSEAEIERCNHTDLNIPNCFPVNSRYCKLLFWTGVGECSMAVVRNKAIASEEKTVILPHSKSADQRSTDLKLLNDANIHEDRRNISPSPPSSSTTKNACGVTINHTYLSTPPLPQEPCASTPNGDDTLIFSPSKPSSLSPKQIANYFNRWCVSWRALARLNKRCSCSSQHRGVVSLSSRKVTKITSYGFFRLRLEHCGNGYGDLPLRSSKTRVREASQLASSRTPGYQILRGIS